MRIIAGEHRGRRIAAPPGRSTRPMLDRVREALFGTLGARVEDARVLDLFAGSGSLALEALSRGARSARMIERDPESLRVLRANVALLGLAEKVEIVRGDALDPARWAPSELVLLDPPYALVADARGHERLVASIASLAREALAGGGVIVLHVPRRTAEDLMRSHPAWEERAYGSSALLYVDVPAAPPPVQSGEAGP